ncbi:hypothetical protein [Spiroplasma endosymbiont of Panorpa germanica]|uniref:hypothetical protein n=1 Tax=Spiroplasma endosymbiont of Panorpa germanica TaxID=3066314 RepID=UPI0030D1F8E5
MRKLLMILGALSLTISIPLNVVSCKKTISDDNFDYEALINDLQSRSQEMFELNMNEDLEKFYYIDEESMQMHWDSFRIQRFADILGEEKTVELSNNSEEFKEFNELIQANANLEKLKKSANEAFLSDINFKPILKGGKSPFASSSIKLDKVTIESPFTGSEDARTNVIKMNYILSSQIEYLNSKGESSISTVSFKSAMYVFEDANDSNVFTEFSQKLHEFVVSDKYSNSFLTVNNSFNHRNLFSEYSQKNNFSEIYDNIFKDPEFQIKGGKSRLKLDTSNAKFDNNTPRFIYHDNWMSGATKYDFNDNSSWTVKSKEALIEGGEKINDLAKEVSGNDSTIYIPTKVHDSVLKNLENNPQSSRYVNSENVFINYRSGNISYDFKSLISRNGIKVDENLNGENKAEANRLLGILGTYVTNVKLEYKSSENDSVMTMELPKQFFITRQLTSFENTTLYYEQLIRAQLLFQREMFGFTRGQWSKSNNHAFVFKKPDVISENFQPGVLYDVKELMNGCYDEAVKKINSANLLGNGEKIEYYIGGFMFNYEPEQFKINEEGYMFFYKFFDKTLVTKDHWFILNPITSRSANYIYGLPNRCFNFTSWSRNDIVLTDFNDDKTAFKLQQ